MNIESDNINLFNMLEVSHYHCVSGGKMDIGSHTLPLTPGSFQLSWVDGVAYKCSGALMSYVIIGKTPTSFTDNTNVPANVIELHATDTTCYSGAGNTYGKLLKLINIMCSSF